MEVERIQCLLDDAVEAKNTSMGKQQETEEFLRTNAKDVERKYADKIRDLEDNLDSLKERAQNDLRDAQTKSEESLQLLKNLFEIEREALEKRLSEEK